MMHFKINLLWVKFESLLSMSNFLASAIEKLFFEIKITLFGFNELSGLSKGDCAHSMNYSSVVASLGLSLS